ncbi:MAG: FAD-binding protein [Treponema sp.]|jgi:electron transfer flavoprotein alpha subunit|nr:FAD-binding protein [Treponema sp.]
MTFAFVLPRPDDPAAPLLWNLIAPVREAEDRVEFWLFAGGISAESRPSARPPAGDPWNIRHTESRLRRLERLCTERRPDLVLLPGIPAGHELGVRLSARLNCGCFPETRALIGEGKRLFARKKVCGSNLDGDAEITAYPAILTVIGKRAIPLQAVRAPLQVVEAPLQAVQAPLQVVEAPLQVVQAPLQVVQAPLQAVQAPLQAVQAPLQAVQAPLQAVQAPLQAVQAPLQVVQAPLQVGAEPSEWILDYEQSESLPSSNPLETAPLLFAAGRGLGSKAACDRLRRVAAHFGAPLGFSRPAALNGWGETREIIGQSGVRCSAEVCIALGISGAAAFMTGIESVSTLIAVNPDRNAPIFRCADRGILASAEEFIAALEAGTAGR